MQQVPIAMAVEHELLNVSEHVPPHIEDVQALRARQPYMLLKNNEGRKWYQRVGSS